MLRSLARTLKPRPLLIAVCAAWAQQAHAVDDKQLYAAPNGTSADNDCTARATPCSLTAARNAVRNLNDNMGNHIVVNLASGTYWLPAEGFALTEEDSGTHNYNVIYQADPLNATNSPPIFSGGILVDKTKWFPLEGGAYQGTNLNHSTPIYPVHARQIYVNGLRAIRAREPNADATTPYLKATATLATKEFRIKTDEVPYIQDQEKVEVSWINHWHTPRLRVQSIDADPVDPALQKITFKTEETQVDKLYDSNLETTPFYYLENDSKFIDAPGEWFMEDIYNASGLSYKPRAGEDLGTAEVIVPHVETLLSIDGASVGQLAHHIIIRGITFQYSNWVLPNEKGYFSLQAGVDLRTTYDASVPNDYGTPIPGAVRINNAQYVRFEGNRIEHTGAHGIFMRGRLADVEIEQNVLEDLSAGGIYVHHSADSTDVVIANNLVRKPGQYYQDAVGILVNSPKRTRIEFNEVTDAPYSGISMGWEWRNNNTMTQAQGNLIRYNYVHDVMKLLDDGGGIYSLGNLEFSGNPTKFHDNHIKSIVRSDYAGGYPTEGNYFNNGGYPIAGIYLDGGSKHKQVLNNLVDLRPASGPLTITGAYFVQPGSPNAPEGDTSTSLNVFDGNRRNVAVGSVNTSLNAITHDYDGTDNGNPDLTDSISAAIAVAAGQLDPVSCATVSSSGVANTDNGSLKAFDGKVNHEFWESTASSTAPSWYALTLCNSTRIRRIQIVGKQGGAQGDSTVNNFKVQVGPNSGSLIDLADVSDGHYVAGTFTWTFAVPNASPKNAPYQYIRITKKTNGQPFKLSEVKVFK